MKHILKLAVCLSAMSPMPALAQTHYESKIEIGGHGGANLSPRVSRKAFFPAQTVESISGIWKRIISALLSN